MTKRSGSRRIVAFLSAVLAVCSLTTFGAVSAANAETCTEGEPPRTLPTDTPGYSETQYCLSGTWTTTSYMSNKPDYLHIEETVEDPKASRYNFNVSDFFDLKKIDPAKIIDAFKAISDGTAVLTDGAKLKERLDLADQKAQALLNRQLANPKDMCRVRSITFSRTDQILGNRWQAPVSTAPAGQPTQITYAFAPDMNDELKVIILNAIDQYPNAVRYQDASFRYPESIVPHDPSDPRPPTITFVPKATLGTSDETGNTVSGTTVPTELSGNPLLGQPVRWVSGNVNLLLDVSPNIVGHEIGHVLGLDDDFKNQTSTMYAVSPSIDSPWCPPLESDGHFDQAFSPCMFLPPVTPNY